MRLLFIILWFVSPPGQAGVLSLGDELSADGVTIGRFLDLHLSTTGQTDLEEIRRLGPSAWTPSSTDMPNFGLTDDVPWGRLTLVNPGPATRTVVLSFGAPYFELSLYHLRGDKLVRSAAIGTRQDYPAEPVYRLPALELTLEPGTHQVYLQVGGDFRSFEGAIRYKADFIRYKDRDSLWSGLVFGMIAMLILTNGILSLALRRRYYLTYVAYLFLQGLFLAFLTGVYRYALGEWSRLMPDYALIIGLECLMVNLFTMSFFGLKKNQPTLYRLFLLSSAIYLVAVLLRWPLPRASILITATSLPAGIVLVITAAVQGIRQGMRQAWFFLGGWFIILIGALILTTTRMGYLPVLPPVNAPFIAGSLLEMIMLSIAVADLYLQNERQRDQRLADMQKAKSLRFIRLAGEVAHEVNNPLSVVAGYSELSLHPEDLHDPGRLQRIFSIINQNCGRIEKVITVLKEVGECSHTSLSLMETDTLIRKSHGAWKQTNTHMVDLKVMSGEAFYVGGYVSLLTYAVTSLLGHAAMLTRSAGRSTFQIRTEIREPHYISITCTVPGEEGARTGMNFTVGSLVEAIMDVHHGELRIEASEGRTRFMLLFPDHSRQRAA